MLFPILFISSVRTPATHHSVTADLVVTLNDNTILEYLLQDDVFMGILGVLECEKPSPRGLDEAALTVS